MSLDFSGYSVTVVSALSRAKGHSSSSEFDCSIEKALFDALSSNDGKEVLLPLSQDLCTSLTVDIVCLVNTCMPWRYSSEPSRFPQITGVSDDDIEFRRKLLSFVQGYVDLCNKFSLTFDNGELKSLHGSRMPFPNSISFVGGKKDET